MRWLLVAACLLLPAPCLAQFSMVAVSKDTTVTKNFVSDFGAVCNGSSHVADEAAGVAFNTFATGQSNPIVLNLPVGGTCCNTSATGSKWFFGVTKVVINGNGATMSGCGTDIYPQWAGFGIVQDNLTNALFTTVSAGATCITLLTPSQASRGTVGSWVAIGGQDTFGDAGYPPDPATYEFLQIATINTTTGQICFDGALQYSYKSTWPNYSGASTWPGGPATIWFLSSTWNTDITYLNVNWFFNLDQATANGKSVKFINGTWTGNSLSGANCFAPSQAQSIQMIGLTMTACTIEIDKIVDTLVMTNTTLDSTSSIGFPSSDGANTATLTNVTGTINGTPRRFFGTNLTMPSLELGPALGFGGDDEFSCTNCTISAITPLTNHGQSNIQTGWAFTGSGVMTRINQLSVATSASAAAGTSVLTFTATPANMTVGLQVFDDTAAGVIPNNATVLSSTPTTITLSANITGAGVGSGDSIRFKGGACNWCVEGKNLIFQAGGIENGQTVTISSVTTSGNYVAVQTTLAGGLPAFSAGQNVYLHPAPRFTCSGCTGSIDIVDLAQAPARTPVYSYSKRTYDGGASGPWPSFSGTAQAPHLWGNVSQVNIGVTKAYSGVQGTLGLNGFAVSSNVTNSSINAATWFPQVNAKTTGTRAITLSGVTGTQTGDSSLTVPDSTRTWIDGQINPSLTAGISGESSSLWPAVTVEVIMNQSLNMPP